jgi:hypothetical protein
MGSQTKQISRKRLGPQREQDVHIRDSAGRGPLPSASGVSFPTWQIERARALHQVCHRIQTRLDRGEPLLRTVRLFSRRWQGKPFHCDPARRWNLSRGTLLRWFYRWQHNGYTPAAFALGYKSGRPRIPAVLVTETMRRCALPGVFSLAAAVRSMARDLERGHFIKGFGQLRDFLAAHPALRKGQRGRIRFPYAERSVYRSFTPKERRAVFKLHRARQRETEAGRRLAAMIRKRT